MVCTIGALAAAEYYLSCQSSYASPGHYYTNGCEPTGVWWNPSGLFDLEDRAEITPESFAALYSGFSPDYGMKLTRNAGLADRDPGKDLHFAPDKTVSALWALAPDDLRAALEEAHNEAVRETLNKITQPYCGYVRTWHRDEHGTKHMDIKEADIMAAMFQHGESREGDPQLHTHVTLFNFGRIRHKQKTGPLKASDFRAHHGSTTFEWKMAMGASYRAALAWRLRHDLGLAVEQYGENREFFRLKGVPEELTGAWSKRRRQIVSAAAREGYTTAAAPERAAGLNKKTRASKKLETRAEARLLAWGDQAQAEIGPTEALIEKVLAEDATFDAEMVARTREDVLAIHHDLVRTEAVFHLKDAIRAVANYGAGTFGLDDIKRLTRQVLNSQEVVQLPKPKLGWARMADTEQAISYTTQRHQDEEAEIVAYTRQMQTQSGFAIEAKVVDRWLALNDVKLSGEQRQAVKAAVEASSGVALIDGAAGSGKSFALRPVARVYTQEGYRVYATAVAWRTAKQLGADCGVINYSLEKFLRGMASGRFPVDSKTVVMVDEYSLLSVRETHRLLRALEDRGAKVIFVGENIQQQAVEAGVGPRLVRDEIDASCHAEITTIRRQKPDIEDYLVFEGMERKNALLKAQMMGAEEQAFYHRVYRPGYEGADKRTFEGTIWKVKASHLFRDRKAEAGLLQYAKRGKVHLEMDQETRLKTIVKDWQRHREITGDLGAVILARTNAEVEDISLRARELLLPPPDQRVEVKVRVARASNMQSRTREMALAVGDVIRTGVIMEGPHLINGSVVQITALREEPDLIAGTRVHLTGMTPCEDGSGAREVAFYVDECRDAIYGDVRLDYGYARTMTSAQGLTEDRIFVLADEFLARETAYAAFTRHRHDLDIYFNRKTLATAVRERLPEDQYNKVITDSDIFKYLGMMLSRDGSKVNALDLYQHQTYDNDGKLVHDYSEDRDKLVAQATKRLADRGAARSQFAEVSWPRLRRLEGKADRPAIDPALIDGAIEGLSRFSARFDRVDAGLWFARSGVAVEDLDGYLHALCIDPRVVPLHDRAGAKFTTVAVLGEERRLLEVSDQVRGYRRLLWNARFKKDVAKVASRHNLSAAMRDFVADVYGGSGLSLAGRMSASERHMLFAALGAYGRKGGERVVALGVSPKDRDALIGGLESGASPSRRRAIEVPRKVWSVEGFLHGIGQGYAMAGLRDVVLVHGAEQLDNGSMAALLEGARRCGFKLMLSGDETGLPGPGRSGALAALIDRHGGLHGEAAPAGLSPLDQALGEGRIGAVLGHLEAEQRLKFHPDRDAAVRAAAQGFAAVAHADRMVLIAATAGECEKINELIQDGRRRAGTLGASLDLFVGVERSAADDGVGRYFRTTDLREKYVRTRFVRVHVGDVIVLRSVAQDSALVRGMSATVTGINGSTLTVEGTVDGVRLSETLDTDTFRGFDLGYARPISDHGRAKFDRVAGLVSERWQAGHLQTLLGESMQPVELHVPERVAAQVAELENLVGRATRAGFVGTALTRGEAREKARTDLAYEDARYDDLTDIERGFIEKLDRARSTALTEAKGALGEIFDRGVRDGFVNDNRPFEQQRQVINQSDLVALSERARGTGPLLARRYESAFAHQSTLEAKAIAWTRQDVGRYFYDAPVMGAMMRTLADLERMEQTIATDRSYYEPALVAVGLPIGKREAVRDAIKTHREGMAHHSETLEARTFAQEMDALAERFIDLRRSCNAWSAQNNGRHVVEAPQAGEMIEALWGLAALKDEIERIRHLAAVTKQGRIDANSLADIPVYWQDWSAKRTAHMAETFIAEFWQRTTDYYQLSARCDAWAQVTGKSAYGAPDGAAMMAYLPGLVALKADIDADPDRYAQALAQRGIPRDGIGALGADWTHRIREWEGYRMDAFVNDFVTCKQRCEAVFAENRGWAQNYGQAWCAAPKAREMADLLRHLGDLRAQVDADLTRYEKPLAAAGIGEVSLNSIRTVIPRYLGEWRAHETKSFVAHFDQQVRLYKGLLQDCQAWCKTEGWIGVYAAPKAEEMMAALETLHEIKNTLDADPKRYQADLRAAGYDEARMANIETDYQRRKTAWHDWKRSGFVREMAREVHTYHVMAKSYDDDVRHKAAYKSIYDLPYIDDQMARIKKLHEMKTTVEQNWTFYGPELKKLKVTKEVLANIEREYKKHMVHWKPIEAKRQREEQRREMLEGLMAKNQGREFYYPTDTLREYYTEQHHMRVLHERVHDKDPVDAAMALNRLLEMAYVNKDLALLDDCLHKTPIILERVCQEGLLMEIEDRTIYKDHVTDDLLAANKRGAHRKFMEQIEQARTNKDRRITPEHAERMYHSDYSMETLRLRMANDKDPVDAAEALSSMIDTGHHMNDQALLDRYLPMVPEALEKVEKIDKLHEIRDRSIFCEHASNAQWFKMRQTQVAELHQKMEQQKGWQM